MKKYLIKCFCISVSMLMGINGMTYNAYANTHLSSDYYNEQCIIKDTNNVTTQEQKEFIKKVFNDSFPKIWKKYGYTQEPPIITFIIDDKLIPADAGGVELGNGLIAFKQNSFSHISEYTTDHIIHELTHVAQEYKNKGTFQWLAEGIADYMASEYSSHKLSLIPTQYKEGELYDGYLVTAGFLKWLEQKYPNTVMKLHRTFQQGNIKYETFQELTGKTLSDLWKEYSGKTLPSMEEYLLSRSKVSDILKLADYYEKGYFGEANYTEALKYYQKAADSGDMSAIIRIANIYYTGKLGKADYEKAFELYNKVADVEISNSVYACNQLGDMIYNNQIENKTLEQAAYYYKRSIEIDEKLSFTELPHSAYAMRRLGDLYSDANDKQAVYWYERAMQNGNYYAQNRLGYFYLEGILVEKDIKKAEQYFMDIFESADSSDDDKYSATTNLGNLYHKENNPQCIYWYEKAAEYGNIDCLNQLGNIYLKGVITQKDIQKASYYFNCVIESEKASDAQKEYANNKLKTIL